jgi:hypothetical protein
MIVEREREFGEHFRGASGDPVTAARLADDLKSEAATVGARPLNAFAPNWKPPARGARRHRRSMRFWAPFWQRWRRFCRRCGATRAVESCGRCARPPRHLIARPAMAGQACSATSGFDTALGDEGL